MNFFIFLNYHNIFFNLSNFFSHFLFFLERIIGFFVFQVIRPNLLCDSRRPINGFCLLTLYIILIDPNFRQLPYFYRFIFTASNKLLGIFVPSHLCYWPIMCSQNIQRWPIFGKPECDAAVFISWDDFTTLVSPKHNSLFRLSLCKSNSFGISFFTRRPDIENRYIPIYIWRK